MSDSDRATGDLLHAIDIAERLIRSVDKLVMANHRANAIAAAGGFTEAWHTADRERNQARDEYVAAQEDLAALKRRTVLAASAYAQKACSMRGVISDMLGINGRRIASQTWRTSLRRLISRKRNTGTDYCGPTKK